MSLGRGQLGRVRCARPPGAWALGAAAPARHSAWASEGQRREARRGQNLWPGVLGTSRARRPGPAPRRHGRGQARRRRSGARARSAWCAPPPLRPSLLVRPPSPSARSPHPHPSPVLGPAARLAVRRDDRGLAIRARWSWRSRVAQGARPDQAQRGVGGGQRRSPKRRAGAGGCRGNRQGLGARLQGAGAPGAPRPWPLPGRLLSPQGGGRLAGGKGGREEMLGWAGGLADREQVGGDWGPAGRGAAARWRAAGANRAAALPGPENGEPVWVGRLSPEGMVWCSGPLNWARGTVGGRIWRPSRAKALGVLSRPRRRGLVEPEAGICGQGAAGGRRWARMGTLGAGMSRRGQGGPTVGV